MNIMIKRIPFPAQLTRAMSFKHTWSSECRQEPKCPSEPSEKYIIQRSCCPSIFESWRPKIPDLKACQSPKKECLSPPIEHRTCTAGMKTIKRCEIEAAARQREKMNHPKYINQCPPIPKNVPVTDLPVLMDALIKCKGSGTNGTIPVKPCIRPKEVCKSRIPESDWDMDGTLH